MLNFRNAKIDDIKLYYSWANDESVRKQSFNSKKIYFEVHQKWFESKIQDENCLMLIFIDTECIEVGQVRIQKENNSEALIGISVSVEQRGKGYSIEMLKKASITYTKNTFINDDITQYINKDYKYDIIISLHDTINHLLNKCLWEKLFLNVSEMLHDEGIFIFDICTKNDLEKNWPDHINIIDKQDYMIISNGEFDQQSKISKIHHNYFLKENDNGTYIRKYDCIEHISFEIEEIINMLRNININNIEVFDLDTKNEVTERTTVAVFICKRI